MKFKKYKFKDRKWGIYWFNWAYGVWKIDFNSAFEWINKGDFRNDLL